MAISKTWRGRRGILAAWGVLAFLSSAASLSADVLVMRDGSKVETKGPYEVKGRRVVFTDPKGQLSVVRLDEVDLEASQRLAAEPPPAAAITAPPKKAANPVLTLTNKDIDGPRPRRVPLPGHGEVTFASPAIWALEVRQPAGDLPPTLVFSPKAEGDFKLLVTLFWSPQGDPKFNSPERLLQMTEAAAAEARNTSDTAIAVAQLAGTAGYWFWAADRAPKPGEYEYLVQGCVSSGKVIGVFTWLTHSEPPANLGPLFSFLASIRHLDG